MPNPFFNKEDKKYDEPIQKLKPEPVAIVETVVEEKVEPLKTTPLPESQPYVAPQKTVIMTELDSQIFDKVRTQTDNIDVAINRRESGGLHRLSLPIDFEQYSYDCTRGDTCTIHSKDKKGQVISGRGKYTFRWVYKHKRAIDEATNVSGWLFSSQSFFPSVNPILFSSSGVVEEGDNILCFMPHEKAERIRLYPRERSQELLRGRMTPSKKSPKRVLMTGNPDSEHVYEPDMSQEESESDYSQKEVTVD